jgi:hypothetical protein
MTKVKTLLATLPSLFAIASDNPRALNISFNPREEKAQYSTINFQCSKHPKSNL